MHRIQLDPSGVDYLLWRQGSFRSVEIFDIAVNSERGVGRGTELIKRLLAELPNGTSMVFAITRISNEIAQQFYEKLGFRIVGRLHNFYRDGNQQESALMYGKDV